MAAQNPQRRYRNRVDREAIRREIESKSDETGIDLPDGFRAVLDRFVEAADRNGGGGPQGPGYTFTGSFVIPTGERNLEYCLPGRRVIPHFVKLARASDENMRMLDKLSSACT